MVQATEDGAGTDLAAGPPRTRHWSLQTESPVRAILVVVADKLGQHCSEVLLAQDEQMVEALPAEGALGSAPRPRPDAGSWLGQLVRFGNSLGGSEPSNVASASAAPVRGFV
jgi:hypothetical protein